MKRSQITKIAYRGGETESPLGINVSFETHKDFGTKGPIARRNVMRALRNASIDYADVACVSFRDGDGHVEEFGAY